jgi:large subunit ribosomal protein L25
MKTITLSGSSRKSVGKRETKLIRKEDKVPAVMYGGEKQIHFCITENDAKKLIITPEVYLIELEIEGNKYKTIVKDTQIHPVTDRILHLDFYQISESKEFKVKLPVKLSGFSRGVKNGGRLRQNFRKLHVLGLEENLPDAIEIDITPLKIGNKKRVEDLSISGVKFLDAANAVVVGVLMARAAVDEDEDEEEEEEVEGEGAEGEASSDKATSAASE